MALAIGALLLGGCNGDPSGAVLVVDAEYDPVDPSNASAALAETSTSAAQIFTVLGNGKLEEFWLILTNAESADEGTIRITVRPLDGLGRPNPDPGTSITKPIDVDTRALPRHPLETFTEFDVGDDPGREVRAGEQYAIVVEFASRAPAGAASDGLPIARVLGRDDDGYADGTASTSPDGATWTNSATDDYIFRTFVLQ
jgi:hypothetical protein